MEISFDRNRTVHISSKSHLNITFNLYQCGNMDIPASSLLNIQANSIFTCVYINNGTALLETNSLAYKVSTNHGIFTFPDADYELRNIGAEPLNITWLSFSGYLVEHYLNRANIYLAKPTFSDPEGYVGEKLNQIYAASQKVPNRYCRMMAMQYEIFTYLLDANPTRANVGEVDSPDVFAIRAVDYIERNYAKNISVDEIATALGISRKHLYSIFNSAVKISPKQYLIYYRIEKACQRLKATAQSIAEIAESVGYINQFYFSKEFKRLTGMTPSEYRKHPHLKEVFSYRTFVPTLQERYVGHRLELPMDEAVISVISPIRSPSGEEGRHREGER